MMNSIIIIVILQEKIEEESKFKNGRGGGFKWKLFYQAHREINFESYQIQSNLDCYYTFSIDLALNEIPFSIKSIEKV